MDSKYTLLFNTITDTISQLEAIRKLLISAQQVTEEMYLAGDSD